MTAEKVANFSDGELPSQIYTVEKFEHQESDQSSESNDHKRQNKKKSLYKKRGEMRPDQLEKARERDRLSQQRRRAKERLYHLERGGIPPRKPSSRKPRSEMTNEELEILREKERVAQQNRRARARLRQVYDESSHANIVKRLCGYQYKSDYSKVEQNDLFQGYRNLAFPNNESQSSLNEIQEEVNNGNLRKTIDHTKLEFMRNLNLKVNYSAKRATPDHLKVGLTQTLTEESPPIINYAINNQYGNEDENHFRYSFHQKSLNSITLERQDLNAEINQSSHKKPSSSLSSSSNILSNDKQSTSTFSFNSKAYDRSKLPFAQLELLRKREREYQRARRARMRNKQIGESGKKDLSTQRSYNLPSTSSHDPRGSSSSDEWVRTLPKSATDSIEEINEKNNLSKPPVPASLSSNKPIARRNTRNLDRSSLSKDELEKLRKAEREYQRQRRERIRANKISELENLNSAHQLQMNSRNQQMFYDDEMVQRQQQNEMDLDGMSNDGSQSSTSFADSQESQNNDASATWPELDCSSNSSNSYASLAKRSKKKVSLEDICVSLKNYGRTSPPHSRHFETSNDDFQDYRQDSNPYSRYNQYHCPPSSTNDIISQHATPSFDMVPVPPYPPRKASQSSSFNTKSNNKQCEKPIGDEWKSWRSGLSSEQLERRRRSNREAQRRRRARMKGLSNTYHQRRNSKAENMDDVNLNLMQSENRLELSKYAQQLKYDDQSLRYIDNAPEPTVNDYNVSRSHSNSRKTGCRFKVTPQRHDGNIALRYSGDGQVIKNEFSIETENNKYYEHYQDKDESQQKLKTENNNESYSPSSFNLNDGLKKEPISISMKEDDLLSNMSVSKRKQPKPRRIYSTPDEICPS